MLENGTDGPPEYQYRAGSLHSLLYSGIEDKNPAAAASYALSIMAAGVGGGNSGTAAPSSHHINSYALSVMPANGGGGGGEVRHYLDNNNGGGVGRCGEFDCGYEEHPPRHSLLVSGIL
jgi:hypothetical protein